MIYWALRPWRQCFDFSGRTTRREYWLFLLQLFVLIFASFFVAGAVFGLLLPSYLPFPGEADGTVGAIVAVVYCLVFIPYLSATVRRIHDHDKSGWMFLLTIIPYVGGLIFLFLTLAPGTEGENDYGPDPRDRDQLANAYEVFS